MATSSKELCRDGDIRRYLGYAQTDPAGLKDQKSKIKRDYDDDDELNDVDTIDDSKSSDESSSSDESCLSDESSSSDADGRSKELLHMVSIYKIMNPRLAGLASVCDMQSLKEAIIDTLTVTKKLKHQASPDTKFGDFSVEWFCHYTEDKSNPQSDNIAKELTGSGQSKIPGDRKSGNVQAFYRIKQGHPEIFLACDGSTYHFILHLADPEFRTTMAKHYVDEDNVLQIEKYCLAGADLSTKTIFKSKQTIHSIQLEQYIASITSVIRTDTKLWEILVKETGKESVVGIHLGLNNVRLKIRMSQSTLAEVLKTISCELEQTSKIEGPLVQTFEYVQRIKNKSKTVDLDKKILEKFLKTIEGNEIIDDLYLSHGMLYDFQSSSSFLLKVEKKKVAQWRSVPSMHDVIAKIKHHFSDSLCMESLVRSDRNSILKYSLEKKAVNLYFNTPDKIKHEPIQKCIHGCVEDDDNMYYRLSNKWFKCASSFFYNTDRNFKMLVQNRLFGKDEKDKVSKIMKYPWQYKSGIYFKTHCKILNIDTEDLKRLMEMLCTKINIVKDDKLDLTEASFLIPDVAELCKDMEKTKKQKSDNKKQKKSSDPSPSTSTTEKSDEIKKKSVREILSSCRSGISAAPNAMQELLKKPIEVCRRTEDSFTIINPVFTKELWSEVSQKFPWAKKQIF